MTSKTDVLSWQEIIDDLSLRMLGAGLAATHILSFLYWNGPESLAKYLNGPARVCWSFYQSCEAAQLFNENNLWTYFFFYLILATTTTVLFFFKRMTRVACVMLLLLTALKAVVIAQDYRFMGNYHYMPFWLTGAFLLLPNKRQVATILVILFYFGAGLLKFNVEWLSGAAMIREPMIQGKLLECATAFGLLFEVYFIFWLLSSRAWKRYLAFAMLVGFHAFSWHIVGFFYPSVMLCLVAFLGVNLAHGENINWRLPSVRAILGVFMACQLIPILFFSNSAVTGEGRILSLNMFDAKTLCQSSVVYQRGNEFIDLPPLIEQLGIRIACDPLVHLAEAKAYCRLLKSESQNGGAPHIAVHLVSKRTTDASSMTVLSVPEVCQNPPQVTWWGGIR